ncbi:MAG: hypothetical protein KF886_23520 [Candidatus Hydrogenedentes bacterium]|nr:hypothetical protein [Candidatus Hydrogenedentota bacterium]
MKSTLSFTAMVAAGLLLAGFAAADTSLKPPADLSTLTSHQHAWHEASSETRKLMAEALGEAGAAQWAKGQGYEPVLDHTQKQFRQGVDQVYRTPDGKIVCLEAKGGTSTLGQRKGLTQGTPEFAVESAADMLKSPRTTVEEKRVAALVLQAAKEGALETVVIHTEHTYGEPKAPRVKEGFHFTTDHPKSKAAASRAATLVEELQDIIQVALNGTNTAARKAAQEAADALKGSALALKLTKTLAKFAAPVLVIVDLYAATQEYQSIEAEFAQGRITEDERLNRHVQQVTGMIGGWAGAAGGAWVGAIGGSAAGAAIGSFVPVIGNAVGATVGGVVGAVAGGIGGYAGGDRAGRATTDWVLGTALEAAPKTGD